MHRLRTSRGALYIKIHNLKVIDFMSMQILLKDLSYTLKGQALVRLEIILAPLFVTWVAELS